MREVSDEVPEKESAEEEEITEDLKDEEYKEEDEEDEDKKKYEDDEADVGDWKGMEKRIKNLEDAIADLKSRFSDKEEMGEDNKGLKSRTVKEEFSEAAVKPIKHNPEIKEVEKRVFAKSKTRTTLDRVLNKLNK
jgi:hypothetical protein